MLNNRGQAFSVFELMIAGVVAFAILVVLLMVIGGIDITGKTGDAGSVISTTIQNLNGSGDQISSKFSLESGPGVTSADVVKKTGLDARSVYFATGQFGTGSNQNSYLVVPDSKSGVQNTGTKKLDAKARVICKDTGAELKDYISSYVPTDKFAGVDIDFTSTEFCGTDFQPCCLVILERPTN